LTRWAIAVLGVLAIAAAAVLPWYTARAVGGTGEMAGWGSWSATGRLDAGLRPLPLAVPVYLSAAAMIWSAARSAFGVAVVGAMATFSAAILPFLTMQAVDRHVPGGESMALEVAAGPKALLAIGFVAAVVCWIGYARCVLRPAPRAP
jgi:hypothetical protein